MITEEDMVNDDQPPLFEQPDGANVSFVLTQVTVVRALPGGYSPVRVSIGGTHRTFLVPRRDLPEDADDESHWFAEVSADALTAGHVVIRHWERIDSRTPASAGSDDQPDQTTR